MKRAFVWGALLLWGCGDGTTTMMDGGQTGHDGGPVIDAPATSATCGDGVVDPGEGCDDHNDTAFDGCEPTTCQPTCTADSECDDGVMCNGAETCVPCVDETCAAGRACAAATDLMDGTGCTDGATTGVCRMGECVMAGCGNGVVEAGEHCDDGNGAGNDGCENDCTFTCEVVDPSMTNTWYLDCDGDGYAAEGPPPRTQCLQPADGCGWTLRTPITGASDCDDTSADAHPGLTEVCDGQDNDCNGTRDDGVLTTSYVDNDGDGYGNTAVSMTACTVPSGYVTSGGDCNDSCPTCFPGNVEACDGVDNDCNGVAETITTYYRDADGDGHGNAGMPMMGCTMPSGYVLSSDDCNDSNGSVYPGNSETCDGIDNNCAGGIDEGVQTAYYRDADIDGYGNPSDTRAACSAPSGYVADSSDCCDSDNRAHPFQSSWYPSQRTTCGGYDFNCDGTETHEFTGNHRSCSFHGTDSAGCNADTAAGWWYLIGPGGLAGGDPGCGASQTWIQGCMWNSSTSRCDDGILSRTLTQQCH